MAISGVSEKYWARTIYSQNLNLYCSVAYNLTSGIPSASSGIMTSSDGLAWSQRTVPGGIDLWDVAWSPSLNLFAAVGSTITGTATNNIITSPDGINWVGRIAPANNSIIWSPGKSIFLAMINNAYYTISTDGITWNQNSTNLPFEPGYWADVVRCIAWSPTLSRFVAFGDSGTMYSSDGANWTQNKYTGTKIISRGIWCAEKGFFIAVGKDIDAGGSCRSISTDGINWDIQPITGVPPASSDISWSPTLSLFVVPFSDYVVTSPDGNTWTKRNAPYGVWNSVTNRTSPARFVVVSTPIYPYGDGNRQVMYSDDGINWLGNGPTPVTGISISPKTANLQVGQTQQITVNITPADATNRTVAYSSSNAGIASVNSSGMITAVSAGLATITVTTVDGGFTDTCSVTVTSPSVPVTGMSMSPDTMALTPGQTAQITVTITPTNATNKNVSFISSNPGVATVNSSGVVTGVSDGVAVITGTTVDGGFTDTCSVTVSTSVLSIAVNPSVVNLRPGQTQQLTVVFTPSTATNKNVTFVSSAPTIATVNNTGLVTAIAAGTATITVTSQDGGKTAQCFITVTTVPPPTPGANEFLPFATGITAVLTPQNQYALGTARVVGHLPRTIADAALTNKSLRQGTSMAAAMGQFIANNGLDALDDGDIDVLALRIEQAILALIARG